MKRLLFLCLLLISLHTCALAETLMVDPSGHGAYASLTAALGVARDGDTIVLAGGVYDDTREVFPIVVDKAITLRAKEGESPVIASPVQVAAMQITAPGTQVEGLAISFLRSGIWVLADNVHVTSCSLTLADEEWRTSSCGMWVGGAKRMMLKDSSFTGCGIALAGPPISESSSDLPVLTGLFEVGEDIEFFATHTISGNLVNGKPLQYIVGQCDTAFSEEAGQLIAVNCENIVISKQNVSRASIGVEVAYCKDVVIDQTIADDSGIFGIYVAKTDRSVVKDSRASHCTHGVDMRATTHSIVSLCQTSGCGQGVFLSWAQNCLVEQCEIGDNCTGFFSAGGNNNHMNACRVEGNQLGLYVQKEPLFLLTGSTLTANWGCGARVTHCSFVCANNVFEKNWVASMALECEQATYLGNVFKDNQNRALYIKDSRAIKLLNNTYTSADAQRNEFVASEEPMNWD